eukprot:110722-Rhodomonas_salina.1
MVLLSPGQCQPLEARDSNSWLICHVTCCFSPRQQLSLSSTLQLLPKYCGVAFRPPRGSN